MRGCLTKPSRNVITRFKTAMASIYRKKYKKKDPETGETVKRYSRKYWIKYRDGDGVVLRVPGCTDRAATLQLAAKLEREAELKKAGVYDPFEQHRKRPLSDHLEDYDSFLQAKGDSEKHVYQVISRARKIIQGCKFVFPSDISPARVQERLAELRRQGSSAQTVNFYMQAIKQFATWMVRDRRVPDNPLCVLTPMNVQKDRRHDRRALAEEELAWLLDAAESGPIVEAISGVRRAKIYMFSAFTGLRRKELASLTPRSLHLDGEVPTVTISAAYTKNGRRDILPLHPVVAEAMRLWTVMEKLGLDDPLFPLRTASGNYRRTSKMMQRDLKAAREKWINEAKTPEERAIREASDFLTYQNHDGLFADFHSNRHTFITNLAKAKVHPKLAQALARHSTINLTMNVYTHVGLDEKAGAVASLPAPKSPTSESGNEPVDDDEDSGPSAGVVPRVVPCGAQNGAQRLSRNGRPMARNGNGELSDRAEEACREDDHKSLPEKRFGKKRKEMAAIDTAISEGKIEVHPARLERATFGSVDRCSIQLS